METSTEQTPGQRIILFNRIMRLEYRDIITHFIKYVNDGNSFGFNVQTTFSPVGTTRKFKVARWIINNFPEAKVEAALATFRERHPQTVNPKRRGKNSWKGNEKPAPAPVVDNDIPAPEPEPEPVETADDATPAETDSGQDDAAPMEHKCYRDLLRLLNMRGHDGYTFPVMLPGPAGSGKTTAAMHVARDRELSFYHTGAVGNQYELLGYRNAAGEYVETAFYQAYKNGGVFLWDEVDASNPAALVAFNAALENGHCAFPGGDVERHVDFIPVAAANTYGHGATHEYVGRNKLDAATLDRFIILDWPYDEDLERRIARNDSWVTQVQKLRAAVKSMAIKHVVSPRASIRGAIMLANGFSRAQAMEMAVFKGLSTEQKVSIMQRAGVI